MRLPIIPPAELNAEQKPLYDDMRDGIAKNFQGFINIRDDSALLGPWNPWIHEPTFGKPVWELTKAMVSNPSLPANVREVAILVTGAHFKSAYELYAHVIVAEHRGLSDEKLATIVAGQRPNDLTRQEAVAYDFHRWLVLSWFGFAQHVCCCGTGLNARLSFDQRANLVCKRCHGWGDRNSRIVT